VKRCHPILLLCFASASAAAQEVFIGNGTAFVGNAPPVAENPDLRPLDPSDPPELGQIAALTGPCGTAPQTPCENVHRLYVAGGDALANYMIGQFEAGIREGYTPDFTLLAKIAYTESETGFAYLSSRDPDRLAPDIRPYRLRALGRTRDPRAIEILASDAELRRDYSEQELIYCIVGIREILERTGADPESALGRQTRTRLRSLRQTRDDLPDQVVFWIDKLLEADARR
jgi:hypothetical protein